MRWNTSRKYFLLVSGAFPRPTYRSVLVWFARITEMPWAFAASTSWWPSSPVTPAGQPPSRAARYAHTWAPLALRSTEEPDPAHTAMCSTGVSPETPAAGATCTASVSLCPALLHIP